MFDHMFTPWGTLTLDGLYFVQNAVIIVGFLGVIAALLYRNKK